MHGVPQPRIIKPTSFKGSGAELGRGISGKGPRKKKDRRRDVRPATQTFQDWMWVAVKKPPSTVTTVYAAEKVRK